MEVRDFYGVDEKAVCLFFLYKDSHIAPQITVLYG
jgi:hypothetical protein